MKKIIGWTFAILAVIAAIVAFDIWKTGNTAESNRQPQRSPPVDASATNIPVVEAPTHYPLPSNAEVTKKQESLQPLQESDSALAKSLSDLLGRHALTRYFYPEKIVRRIVATVDNLPRHTVATNLLPVKPVDGKFLTTGEGTTLAIAPENAARYTPYVHLLETADTKKLVSFYVYFYPLFQQAYQDLGYPDGYFNDRLIAVIDHLLATPEVHEPIMLVQPKVLAQFADQDLEGASSGRKILMRMGSGNAAKVKTKLREIRKQLTGTNLK